MNILQAIEGKFMFGYFRSLMQKNQYFSSNFPIELLIDRSVQHSSLLSKEFPNDLEQFPVTIELEKMTYKHQQ